MSKRKGSLDAIMDRYTIRTSEGEHMAYKCRICGSSDVNHPGDVCELCALNDDSYGSMGWQQPMSASSRQRNSQNGSDPYQSVYIPESSSTGQASGNDEYFPQNTNTYGGQIDPQNSRTSVPVFRPGQAERILANHYSNNYPDYPQSTDEPTSGRIPVTQGIVRNINMDNQKRSGFIKWMRSLFLGTPFTWDDEITMFQVFPDFSGTVLNRQGNAADQVVMYGHLNRGMISENNEVEIYGRRDVRNNIIAHTVVNRSTGARIIPRHSLSATVIRVITLLVMALLALGLFNVDSTTATIVILAVLVVMNYRLVIRFIRRILRRRY